MLIWGLPLWSAAIGIAFRRWWVIGLPVIACTGWALWAWPRVDPSSVDWMRGDVEMTVVIALPMGVLAAATGVVIGRMLRTTAAEPRPVDR